MQIESVSNGNIRLSNFSQEALKLFLSLLNAVKLHFSRNSSGITKHTLNVIHTSAMRKGNIKHKEVLDFITYNAIFVNYIKVWIQNSLSWRQNTLSTIPIHHMHMKEKCLTSWHVSNGILVGVGVTIHTAKLIGSMYSISQGLKIKKLPRQLGIR